jgi:hypothetical protein
MVDEAELAAIDDYRFEQRIPSRAAAVRQLLRLGLLALKEPKSGRRSAGYGVLANSGGSEDDASAEG